MSNSSAESLTSFHTHGDNYELRRYPFERSSQLRAWDAADSYLLDQVQALQGNFKRLCIVHDNFGALTIPLYEHRPLCIGDSWMSLEAIRRNLDLNSLETELDFESDLTQLTKRSDKPDLIIGRVPKSKSQLSYLLANLNKWVEPGCILLLSGMDKHLSKGQFDLLDKQFGPASFLPGVKKARVWKAIVDKDKDAHCSSNSFDDAIGFDLPDFQLQLKSLPNVFSNDHLDIGSRFFLEQYARLPQRKHVADLACGNGVLGLAYLREHPTSNLYFYDESFQAVRSAEHNLNINLPDISAEFIACDGLKKAASSSLDLVLCNPPFHQQNTVSTAIARSFFKDAKRALVPGGEIWIVANRHLSYHIDLKKTFGNFENISGNKKFVVIKAVKR